MRGGGWDEMGFWRIGCVGRVYLSVCKKVREMAAYCVTSFFIYIKRLKIR